MNNQTQNTNQWGMVEQQNNPNQQIQNGQNNQVSKGKNQTTYNKTVGMAD